LFLNLKDTVPKAQEVPKKSAPLFDNRMIVFFFKNEIDFISQHTLAKPTLVAKYESPHFMDTDRDRLLLIWPKVTGRDVNIVVKGEQLCIDVSLEPLTYE
jgi:hypothetical protein